MRPSRPNPYAPLQYGALERITENVYLFRNIVNSSIVIGDKGVAVIDTQVNRRMGFRVLEAVRTITDKPILYTVNTHYHWDHTNGNIVFHDVGATVISRDMTKNFMVSRAPRQKAFLQSRGFELGEDPYLPDETFQSETELNLGNQSLHLIHLGAAETDDAVAVRIPKEHCIVSGDTIMTGSFPIFGQPVMNEGLMANHDWINTIRELRTYQPDHVLPGHGPLAHDAEIDLLLRIEEYFLTEVRKRVDEGMELNELLVDLENHLPDWITQIAEVWGTPRYAALRVYRGLIDMPEPGWQHFKPSVVPTADPSEVEEKSSNLDSFEGYRQAAEELGEGGDIGLMLAVLRDATRQFPENPAAWTELAKSLNQESRVVSSVLEKGDFFSDARIAIQTALELDPEYAPALLLLGQTLITIAYRNGDDPAAGLAYIHRALNLPLTDIQLAQAYFSIGLANRTNGAEPEAKAAFARAIEANPKFMPAQMANMV
ncbi:MAG: MBL fold metallo-hydrolase [Candidatus Poribacteria bacterium]|nr:MBL fold metallo-hydrolase [Candidatus Poribacteria bacterium]MDE0505133.1 MBL fold metallo-hydrolase [Candidatus Poribacteria bacterium]